MPSDVVVFIVATGAIVSLARRPEADKLPVMSVFQLKRATPSRALPANGKKERKLGQI